MKTKEIIEKNLKWFAVFICIVLTIGIAKDVLSNQVNKFDVAGYNFISKYLISDNLTPVVKMITQFGGEIFLILFAIILFVVIKNRRIGFMIWLNLGISALLNQILKHIVQRPRPVEDRIIDVSGYSFPSGHSMVSTAFYGFLIYLIYKNIKNRYLKISLIILLSILIIFIGTSRIYLGVHYTSDVLAGFLIAISYLIVFITYNKRKVLINNRKSEEKMKEFKEIAMKKAIEESKVNFENNYKKGGPFGAVIVKDGEIISSAHNTVIESHDATAHAEMNAIRAACNKLNTHDLSGCTLYTSAEPCPMCLSAIIWANIKIVYYANTKKDADDIGFRDDIIYEYIKGNNKEIIEVHHIESEDALEVFKKFKELEDKTMY